MSDLGSAVEQDVAAERGLVTPERLRSFFAPRHVALVGASDASGWSRNVYGNMQKVGGAEVSIVNTSRSVVHGRSAFRSLAEVSDPIDLAYLFVGRDRVSPVLDELATVGVRNAVVLAAGYGEIGDEGKRLQEQLRRQAQERDITVLGPNSLGFITPGVAAPYGSGFATVPDRGPVGFALQSGSLASALIPFAADRRIGFSSLVAVGNELMISALDVFSMMLDDPETKVVALFLETIRDAERFLALCDRALELGKPVVVLKSGRTEAGQRAAAAHTGAVANDDAVLDAALRQHGVIRVFGIEEMVVTAGLLAYSPRLPQGSRMAVVTSSGGGCNLIADLADDHAISLPKFSAGTTSALRDILPEFAAAQNPLDVTGTWLSSGGAGVSKPEDLAVTPISADESVDFVLHVMTALPDAAPADPAPVHARIEALGQIFEQAAVPTFTTSLASRPITDFAGGVLKDAGLHLLGGIDLGVKAISHAVRWMQRKDDPIMKPTAASPITAGTVTAGAEEAARRSGAWSEKSAQDFLSQYIPVVPSELVTTADGAVAASVRMGQAVAMKICSAEIQHKSDLGGVVLNVSSESDVRGAFHRITEATSEFAAEGVLVSPMREPGVEVAIGVTRDPTFGLALTVGLGGIWVETIKDFAIGVLPLSAGQIERLFRSLKGFPILAGARGRDAVDLDTLVSATLAITRAASALGDDLEALEVNPLRVDERGVEALDALIITRGE